jgi:hypothetical protein
MVYLIASFIIFLIVFHAIVYFINDASKLDYAHDIIEYLWLFFAFGGVLIGFSELERMNKSNAIQREHTQNWADYNDARMKIIGLNYLYSSDRNKEKEEYRWIHLFWEELERGYDNVLWQSMVFSNYDRIIARSKYSSFSLPHGAIQNTRYILDTSKVTDIFLAELRPILLQLSNVKDKWRSPEQLQKELGIKSESEVYLRKFIPYLLFLILTLRITRVYVGKKLSKLKEKASMDASRKTIAST